MIQSYISIYDTYLSLAKWPTTSLTLQFLQKFTHIQRQQQIYNLHINAPYRYFEDKTDIKKDEENIWQDEGQDWPEP